MDITVPADHRVKSKESEKRDKYQDFAREKKSMEHKSYGDTDWCVRYSQQRVGTGTEGLGDKRTSRYHPNNSIVKFDQNTKKSPGNLRRLVVP